MSIRRSLRIILVVVLITNVLTVTMPNTNVRSDWPESSTIGIRKLFDRTELGDDYPYDIDTIKNMTLVDLNWTLEDIDGDGNITTNLTYGGKDIWKIESCFGGDPYTMIPYQSLVEGNVSDLKTITLKHFAILYVPKDYPNGSYVGHAALFNSHETFKAWEYEGIALILNKAFGIPVLVTGEFPENYQDLGFTSTQRQSDIFVSSMLAYALRNEASADALKMSWFYQMIRANLLATTVLARWTEDLGGNINEGIYSYGFSKQGLTRWYLGMLDDRVKVITAGGAPIQDMRSLAQYCIRDWGLPPYPLPFPVVMIEPLMSHYYTMYEWSVCFPETDSAASLFFETYDIASQIDLIEYPDFISILGDVTTLSCKHDGRYMPFGQETPFLRNLTNKPWRYGRKIPPYTNEKDRYMDSRYESVIQLLEPDLTYWPKVEAMTGEVMDVWNQRYLKVDAQIQNPEPLMNVRLWYAQSTNRAWNDEEQEEEHPWAYENMTATSSTNFTIMVPIDPDLQVAYYVEAINPDPYYNLNLYDACPVEFLQEFPPVLEGGADFWIKEQDINVSNLNPDIGEIVNFNVTIHGERIIPVLNYTTFPYPTLRIKVGLKIDNESLASEFINITDEANLDFEWTAEPGTHTAVIIIDPDNNFPDRDRNNNSITFDLVAPIPNQPPTIDASLMNSTVTMYENETINFSVTAFDEDVLNLTYNWKLDGNVIFDWNESYFQYYADYDNSGTHILNITVMDSGQPGLSAYFEWNITVINVNRLPIITSYSPASQYSVDEEENGAINFQVNAMDPDNDPLLYSWYLDDVEQTTVTNIFTFNYDYTSAGEYEIKVIINDDKDGTSFIWQLHVNNTNRAPILDSYFPITNPTINDTTTITFCIEAHDPDMDDTLEYRWYKNYTEISGEIANWLVYIPGQKETGFYMITVDVRDGQGGMITYEWTLTIQQPSEEQEQEDDREQEREKSLYEPFIVSFNVIIIILLIIIIILLLISRKVEPPQIKSNGDSNQDIGEDIPEPATDYEANSSNKTEPKENSEVTTDEDVNEYKTDSELDSSLPQSPL